MLYVRLSASWPPLLGMAHDVAKRWRNRLSSDGAELRHNFMREAVDLVDQVRGRTSRPQHEFGEPSFNIASDLVAAFLW